MTSNFPSTKRVLFLMSDTGGGHRAAADAIQAAMYDLYPDTYDYEMVDVFKHYTPFPFNQMPDFYPVWINKSKRSWHLGYLLTNTRSRSKIVLDSFHLSWKKGVRRLFENHPSDIIVCVHPLFSRTALRILNREGYRPPFVTVVTDLVTTHAFWYENLADQCLMPTLEAYERGLKYGMKASKMKITGLPIHPNFVKGLTDKQTAREQLGWRKDKLTVLMVGGGQGIGPMFETARAINAQNLDIQLIIITGSNATLKAQLEECSWNQPTQIYPFVKDIARFMAASDIFITKAGPGSICEACVAGLPMIISSYIPGQEDGNVTYVVENKAGIYAPTPERVALTLRDWVKKPSSVREAYAKSAAALGRPQAAWEIAQEVHKLAQGNLPVRTKSAPAERTYRRPTLTERPTL